MKKLLIFVPGLFLLISCSDNNQIQDLSGSWNIRTDRNDIGIEEDWYEQVEGQLITLPGSMAACGLGDDISIETEWTGQIVDSSWYTDAEYEAYRKTGNVKIPFWLQPGKKYQGASWYQKEIDIPLSWKDRRIILDLERVHWESRLWVDNREAGTNNRLATPHSYDLTGLIGPGRHILSLRVDNRIKDVNPGPNSHSISDHTQSNWNGIAGDITIRSLPLISIDRVDVYPDVNNKTVWIDVILNNSGDKAVDCLIDVKALSNNTAVNHEAERKRNYLSLDPGTSKHRFEYLLGDGLLLWDEFQPAVYDLEVKLKSRFGKQVYNTVFGMRKIGKYGTQFSINDRPVFLRGTLECSIFPLTGFPSTSEEQWRRIFRIIKDHGLNHMRFHSWCPPEAAFNAADKEGIYLQVECSSWANSGSSIGDSLPIDNWLIEESKSIIQEYGNHPSFCMLAYGNEPAGSRQKEWLGAFINHWKERDNRRVYTGGAGWPVIDENDYQNIPQPRIQGWGQELNSIINREAPGTDFDWSEICDRWEVPVVSHEIGQWCVYPDFREIEQYTGVLKAKNFEIFRETLFSNGLGSLAEKFMMASGKLQALCYKADIEAALRTKGMGGFQLLDLHDFPGQGTALVGVLNSFWGEKGYISPAEYKRFSGETVPLCRLSKRIFTENDTMHAEFEIAHFGKEMLKAASIEWKLESSDEIIKSADLQTRDIDIGNGIALGGISLPLKKLMKDTGIYYPVKAVLSLMVNDFVNSWDIWIYPEQKTEQNPEDEIYFCNILDNEAEALLNEGGKVLLSPEKGKLKDKYGGDIGIGFSSIFWNTAWTRGQKPHTLGILCDPEHPVFNYFPTEYHSNWQWWDAMSHANAILLSSFNTEPEPLVRVIDDWFTNRSLGLIVEARCGDGKIIISGVDFSTDYETRPEARQLLYSIREYMLSKNFNPSSVLEIEEVKSLTSDD